MFEGTDLPAIEGMSYSTVLALLSEVGIEGIKKFTTAKHFVSWLRLVPNTIGNLKESAPLQDFFHRINFRKGKVSAISATARKLAVIIWNMVVKGAPYINPEGYLFLDQKRKPGLIKRIKKQIDKFALTNEDLGIATI